MTLVFDFAKKEYPNYLSPLRYTGGKTRAAKVLYKLLPDGLTEICSPFLGGGAFEIYMSRRNITVYASDNFEPLVNFWNVLMTNNNELFKLVKQKYPVNTEDGRNLKEQYNSSNNPIERASIFYLKSLLSYGGTHILTRNMLYKIKESKKFINRIKEFTVVNLNIEVSEFKDALNKHQNKYVYLDPPYYLDVNHYGGQDNKLFPHEELAKILKSREGWMLSYNDRDYIRKLYTGYKILEMQWYHAIVHRKNSKEIVILG